MASPHQNDSQINQYPNTTTDMPNFTNEEGQKFWVHGELNRIAKKRGVDVQAFVAQTEAGYTSIILVDSDQHIVYESQQSEAIECHIEWLAKVNEQPPPVFRLRQEPRYVSMKVIRRKQYHKRRV